MTAAPDFNALPVWDSLLKRQLVDQLGEQSGLRILDFGSGRGFLADYYAQNNQVTALEPSEEAVKSRFMTHDYSQLTGDITLLSGVPDSSFELILCHNVLEYASNDREKILRELERLLSPGGRLSVVKHNRAGRVMQMAVLKNDFDRANALLDGDSGRSELFGDIVYYEDGELSRVCKSLEPERSCGIRVFWDLQQNQDVQRGSEWQKNMLALEKRVSRLEEFYNIAFFHHLILKKRGVN